MPGWTVELTGAGSGTVRHEDTPRFLAHWTTGGDPDELAGIEGPCWTDEGSGDEDAIHLYGFEWSGPAPPPGEFERLMATAAREIDAWISRRL